ncbi:MAG: alpha/beta hydrolase, partial [bacterium]|nr:alpha/beta hydrolase [bacterium]
MSSTRARRHLSSGLFYYLRPHPAIINAAILWALLTTTPGCFFSEKSFPIDHEHTIRADTAINLPARQWLANAHKKLKHLLPYHEKPTLITDDLSDRSGNPVDLVATYELQTDKLESLFVNFLGLGYTMQVVGGNTGNTPAPPWTGFRDVWVPINADLELAGRLGLAKDDNGKIIATDCIVLMPGLCGGNNIMRQRDLAVALRTSGLHVLAIETRGQGQTAVRYPDIACTWGMLESYDLLIVADWLEDMPHVKRTGLIGFSWGGTYALLTAWIESQPEKHPSITPKVARILPKLPRRRRYQAGAIAFSPVLGVDAVAEKLAKPQSYLIHPFRAGLQNTIRNWKTLRGFPNPTGALHDVIRCKQLDYDDAYEDQVKFLRFAPYKGKPAGNKLAIARIPILIAHTANDPIAPVQTLGNMIAKLKNQNIAAT